MMEPDDASTRSARRVVELVHVRFFVGILRVYDVRRGGELRSLHEAEVKGRFIGMSPA